MGRVEKSIEIKAPPEKVWEMLALDRFEDWDKRARESMKIVEYTSEVNTPEDKCKVGASARITDDRGKQFFMEVEESLENEKIVYHSDLMSSSITNDLEPVKEGTILTKTTDYELPYGSFGRLADKLFGQRMVGKETERSFEQFKTILEK